jgi:hypothetical protein
MNNNETTPVIPALASASSDEIKKDDVLIMNELHHYLIRPLAVIINEYILQCGIAGELMQTFKRSPEQNMFGVRNIFIDDDNKIYLFSYNTIFVHDLLSGKFISEHKLDFDTVINKYPDIMMDSLKEINNDILINNRTGELLMIMNSNAERYKNVCVFDICNGRFLRVFELPENCMPLTKTIFYNEKSKEDELLFHDYDFYNKTYEIFIVNSVTGWLNKKIKFDNYDDSLYYNSQYYLHHNHLLRFEQLKSTTNLDILDFDGTCIKTINFNMLNDTYFEDGFSHNISFADMIFYNNEFYILTWYVPFKHYGYHYPSFDGFKHINVFDMDWNFIRGFQIDKDTECIGVNNNVLASVVNFSSFQQSTKHKNGLDMLNGYVLNIHK